MDELRKLQRLAGRGLGADDTTVYTLSCKYAFEPNGKASETWEYFFEVVLPRINYHWKGKNGWQEGTKGIPMRFKARDLDSAIKQAIYFLQWYYRVG